MNSIEYGVNIWFKFERLYVLFTTWVAVLCRTSVLLSICHRPPMNFPFVIQNDWKLQISQDYIIRILQHFATKLWNITNFVMLVMQKIHANKFARGSREWISLSIVVGLTANNVLNIAIWGYIRVVLYLREPIFSSNLATSDQHSIYSGFSAVQLKPITTKYFV
jgi:hypothetical protein